MSSSFHAAADEPLSFSNDGVAGDDIAAMRSAYLAAVMTLPVADRFAELEALAAAFNVDAEVVTVGNIVRMMKAARR